MGTRLFGFRAAGDGKSPSGLAGSASSPHSGAPFLRGLCPRESLPTCGEVAERQQGRKGFCRLPLHQPLRVEVRAVLDALKVQVVLAARLGGDGTRLAQCGGGCHAVPCLDGGGSQAAIAPCDAVGVLDLHHIPPQRILGHGCDLAGLGGAYALAGGGGVICAVVGAPVTQRLAVDQLIAAERRLRFGIPDPRSGGFFLGIFSSLSFGVMKGFTIGGLAFFDALDYLTAKIMLPLGGMLTCIFVGTRVDKKVLKAELTNEGTLKFRLFGAYVFFMKYVAPIAIGIVFLNELGILKWITGK